MPPMHSAAAASAAQRASGCCLRAAANPMLNTSAATSMVASSLGLVIELLSRDAVPGLEVANSIP